MGHGLSKMEDRAVMNLGPLVRQCPGMPLELCHGGDVGKISDYYRKRREDGKKKWGPQNSIIQFHLIKELCKLSCVSNI